MNEVKKEFQVLTVREVEDKTSLKRVTLWRLEKRGDFPARVNLTDKKVGWFKSDIDNWIDTRSRGIISREVANEQFT